MFSTIIVNDSKPNEKPECLQGDVALVITAKKVEQNYETATAINLSKEAGMGMGMEMFANIGIAVRHVIDTMYKDNKEAGKLALKVFTKGFNKTVGEVIALETREEGGRLDE